MVRRRAAARSAAADRFMRFVEADWPGRCSFERWEAWRAAGRAWAAFNGVSLGLTGLLRAQRTARRALSPYECELHPWTPHYTWGREGGVVKVRRTNRDGSVTLLEFTEDDPALSDVYARRGFLG